MKCRHCAGPLRIYTFQHAAAKLAPQRVNCQRCGSSHSLLRGEAEAINPRPLPLGSSAMPVNMPWRDRSTRPIDPGQYEVRFSDIEPRMVTLEWDGRDFRWQGKKVSTRTLLAWRGEWIA